MDWLQRLNRSGLDQWSVTLTETYREASPFPHVVIDDFLDEGWLEAVEAEFPGPGEIDWWAFDSDTERKLGLRDVADVGPATRQLMAALNSSEVIDFASRLSGIAGLVPDPHFYGAGLHQIERGGFLKVHADFNLHPVTGLQRRLNLILFLNRDWSRSYGGALELWDPTMTNCVEAIEPVWNRCVVFDTSSTSFHGHPEPLLCPEGRTRRSVSVYYYSRPDPGARAHNTRFRSRPGESRLGDTGESDRGNRWRRWRRIVGGTE